VNVTHFDIPGLLLIEPRRHGDARGWFAEVWQEALYREAGVAEPFVQDNVARSAAGVLRGLHGQQPNAQGKLVQVFEGRIFDVAVDARAGSPTFGLWQAAMLDADTGAQFYLPPGLLHGYFVMSDTALIGYKTTDIYAPQHELAVRWDDPDLAIDWPIEGEPVISAKDRAAPRLADLPRGCLTPYFDAHPAAG
jgi:dTDP-4-dehydrorhamnose 3,5-epimerase